MNIRKKQIWPGTKRVEKIIKPRRKAQKMHEGKSKSKYKLWDVTLKNI